MKKILIVTYYWPPSGGAGVQRWLKFAKYLSGFGYELHIVTVDPHKAFYAVRDESLLSEVPENVKVYRTNIFEPFGIYKKLFRKESVPFAGISEDAGKGFIQTITRFIRGNFFIPDARIGWNKYAYSTCSEIIEKEKIDMVITTSPPHSTQLIGLKLKKKFGKPWIADLRDPWTDIYYYSKMLHTWPAKRIDARFERKVLEGSDAIITVSDFIRKQFLKKSPAVNGNKIQVIPNGFDEADFNRNIPVKQEKKFIITYTGTLTENYSTRNFINALRKLKKLDGGDAIKMKYVGSMPQPLYQEFRSLGETFEFQPYVKHSEAVKLMENSTVLLLAVHHTNDNKGILTGKMFEYLAARKPIIFIGPKDGDASNIIADCKAGRTFEPSEEETLYEYLLDLFNKWKSGDNLDIKTETYKKFSRQAQAKQLDGIIKDLLDD